MATTWRSIKDAEKFNKGRAAVRGDFLAGDYNRCRIASFDVPYTKAGRVYRASLKGGGTKAVVPNRQPNSFKRKNVEG